MTNEADYSPITYNGNDATTEFGFGWKIFADSELIVKLIDSDENEETLTLNSDYTVTFNSVGGSVTFTSAPASDKIVFIARNVPNYQSTGYSTSVGFQGSEIEKSFDRVSCNLQEMDYNIEDFKTEINTILSDVITAANDIETALATVSDASEQAVTTLQKAEELTAVCEETLTNVESAGTAAITTLNGLTNNPFMVGTIVYTPNCITMPSNFQNLGTNTIKTISVSEEDFPVENTIELYKIGFSGSTNDDSRSGMKADGTLTYTCNVGNRNLYTDDATLSSCKNKSNLRLFHKLDSERPGVTASILLPVTENVELVDGSLVSTSGYYDMDNIFFDSAETWTLGYMDAYNMAVCGYESPPVVIPANTTYISNTKTYTVGDSDYYYADDSDLIISDNNWLTSITDGKYLYFGEGMTQTTYCSTSTDTYFSLDMDIITPESFTATTDIFYGYRALILRIGDTDGSLVLYYGGYKSSSSLAWRLSKISTGITLDTNRKYHITVNAGTSTEAGSGAEIIVTPYSEEDDCTLDTESAQTYTNETTYMPYNYYNGYDVATIYHADSSPWFGGFLNLNSLKLDLNGNIRYSQQFSASYATSTNTHLILPSLNPPPGMAYWMKISES